MSKVTWSRTSFVVLHIFTPSEPQDSTGLTTIEKDSFSTKELTSEYVLPQASRTALRPAALMAFCCTLLLRRSPPEKIPLLTTLSSHDKLSANVTPDSLPTMHATIGILPAAFLTADAVSTIVDSSSTSAKKTKPLVLLFSHNLFLCHRDWHFNYMLALLGQAGAGRVKSVRSGQTGSGHVKPGQVGSSR